MSTPPQLPIYTSPYRAKKSWPPNLAELTKMQQFRLERRYRRRSKLKWARPAWSKATKLAQFGLIGFVTVYGVLFLDWKQEKEPFEGIRKTFDEWTGNIWTRPMPERGARRDTDASPVASDAPK